MTLSDYLSSNNLTQAEFASRVGVKQAAITRYSKGDRFPRQEHVDAIEKETGGQVTANDHARAWREARERKVKTEGSDAVSI